MSKLNDSKDLIHELAELLDKSSLSEIEVEDEGMRIRVARTVQATTVSYAAPTAAPAAAPAAAAPAAAAPQEAAPSNEEINANHPGAVKSPMVGTIYTKPSPEADAFVSEGDSIKEGQPLLIIEAMKVMNQIPAPKSGVVKKIFFSDAQPVEFGELLCIIE